MTLSKVYLQFLILVFCLHPVTADAIGIGSFQPINGYLISKSDIGTEAVRLMTDKGMAALEGKHSYYSYHTNQKKPYSAQRVLEHYMGILEKLGGKVIWVEDISLGGKFFVGKVNINGDETWISVEVKSLRNYDVSLLERAVAEVPNLYSAQNTQTMIDDAEALILLKTVDKTKQLQLDASFKPGSAVLNSIPPQFKRIAVMLRMDDSYSFRVEAPVDFPAKGTTEERRLLARNRQRAIYDALIASGVPASRLTMEYPIGQDAEEITKARIVLL